MTNDDSTTQPHDASVFETGPHETPTLTPQQIWRSIGAVTASAFAASLTFSICMPLLSLILEDRGTPSWLIGLNNAAQPAGLLIFTLILPRVVQRLGTMRALYLGFVLMIMSIALLPVFDNVWAWFPLRFIMGIGIAIHWVVSETWINTLIDNRIRGRVMGIYVTALSAGYLAGLPVLLFVGTEGTTHFFIVVAALAIGVLPILLARDLAPHITTHEGFGIIAAIRRAPATMFAALTDGLVLGALFVFFLIYVERQGFLQETAITMLIVMSTGNVMLQYPVGMIADRFDRRILLIIFAALISVCTAIFPMVLHDDVLLWPLLFFWGGIMGGIYTCGLAHVGQRFRRQELSAANATFVSVYELGHLIGPPAAGFAMALWDPHGLIVFCVTGGLLFAVIATVRHLGLRGTDSD
ncbi:MAG: MFS transporter [Rhodospirillales bacterium]|nr:MFS transporter [Rhodospirillales bacterium]